MDVEEMKQPIWAGKALIGRRNMVTPGKVMTLRKLCPALAQYSGTPRTRKSVRETFQAVPPGPAEFSLTKPFDNSFSLQSSTASLTFWSSQVYTSIRWHTYV